MVNNNEHVIYILHNHAHGEACSQKKTWTAQEGWRRNNHVDK